jgi:hypothetical protein
MFCRLFGDVRFLLVGLFDSGADFHGHFHFGFLAGMSDLGLQTIFSKQVECRARSETFHSLAGRRLCTFRTQSASLASRRQRNSPPPDFPLAGVRGRSFATSRAAEWGSPAIGKSLATSRGKSAARRAAGTSATRPSTVG